PNVDITHATFGRAILDTVAGLYHLFTGTPPSNSGQDTAMHAGGTVVGMVGPGPELDALALLGRPSWASTAGGFVNWLKNLQRSGHALTAAEADAIIAEAKNLGIEVRLDPPHPNTPWNVEHLN